MEVEELRTTMSELAHAIRLETSRRYELERMNTMGFELSKFEQNKSAASELHSSLRELEVGSNMI